MSRALRSQTIRLHKPTRRGTALALVLGAVLVALPWVVPVEHHGAAWDAIPAFWALFGFVGCAVIVLASKALGHALLQRPEDWYDDGEDEP